jgi:hypothetical protein
MVCTHIKYSSVDPIMEEELGGACSRCGEYGKIHNTGLFRKAEGKRTLGGRKLRWGDNIN